MGYSTCSPPSLKVALGYRFQGFVSGFWGLGFRFWGVLGLGFWDLKFGVVGFWGFVLRALEVQALEALGVRL